MTEFALLIDGALSEIRQYEMRPPDIPHKKLSWHPVIRDKGPTAFTGLQHGSWVVRTALPKLEELRALHWRQNQPRNAADAPAVVLRRRELR